MTEKAKNKGGRPEKFTREWADKNASRIPDLMANGESIAEVCVSLGIGKDSLYKCRDISSKFSDALKHGLTNSESWWLQTGRKGATGEIPINATTWIYNVKNRFKWRDNTKDFVKVDLSDCNTNLDKINRITELASMGDITLDDALKYKALIKTAADEEITDALARLTKLEQLAAGEK